MFPRSIFIALALAGIAGCTDMHTIEPPASQPKVLEQLQLGDHVQVVVKNGSTYAIELTDIQRDALVGHDRAANKNWKIPYREIARIDYRKVSTATKVGAVASGVVITGYVTMIVIVVIAIASL